MKQKFLSIVADIIMINIKHAADGKAHAGGTSLVARAKKEDAENKHYYFCILCGDYFVMRGINAIFVAIIAEKKKYVFIQQSKLANL